MDASFAVAIHPALYAYELPGLQCTAWCVALVHIAKSFSTSPPANTGLLLNAINNLSCSEDTMGWKCVEALIGESTCHVQLYTSDTYLGMEHTTVQQLRPCKTIINKPSSS